MVRILVSSLQLEAGSGVGGGSGIRMVRTRVKTLHVSIRYLSSNWYLQVCRLLTFGV